MDDGKIYRLTNEIRHYDWGSMDVLRELFNISNPGGKPQAEIWMGAHHSAPSWVPGADGVKQTVIDLIKADAEGVLGTNVCRAFGASLPFLFKVLSAAGPLSIQAHPNAQQARQGFEREENVGPALTAPTRNYKDPNHKPELIYALTPFRALKGFRPMDEMILLLERLSLPILALPLKELKKNRNKEGLKHFYSWLMSLSDETKRQLVQHSIDAARGFRGEAVFELVLHLAQFYPCAEDCRPQCPDTAPIGLSDKPGQRCCDIGVLSPLLLNMVELQPGEAMYLEAGELHAYMEGTGMELMANSDNVLRGGLTPKHVDVPELLRVLSFNYGEAERLTPSAGLQTVEMVFTTPAREFQFSVITLTQDSVYNGPVNRAVEILFCGKGSGRLTYGDGQELTFSRGESLLIPASVQGYTLHGDLTVYKATVPA